MCKRERKTKTKVKSVGSSNMKQKSKGTNPPDPVNMARNGRERITIR